MTKSPIFWLIILLVPFVLLAASGPAERSLGTNVRVVYLHGVWVWAGLAALIAAGAAGAVGIITHNALSHAWSRALGRTGMLFWITYLPISIWAMETNWNGLYLAEPRWRIALIFAIAGLLMQIGLALIGRPVWTSVGNLGFVAALLTSLARTQDVMHPASPILGSDSRQIQFYFSGLLLFALLIAWQVARGWLRLDPPAASDNKSRTISY